MDLSIFYFFYNFAHQGVFLDALIVFFAVYFSYVVILLAAAYLLFHHEVISSEKPFQALKNKWRECLVVFFSAGFAWIVAKILKTLIHTSRPFLALPDVQPLFIEPGYAFPSGHATFFMALALSLFFINKKVGWIFVLFALVIGVARIAAGVHFPMDILGGFVLGGLVAYLVKNI